MRNEPTQQVETARLHLRSLASKDAADIVEFMTPPVCKWLADWPSPLTLDMALAKIESSREMARQGNMLPFAIISQATRECCGWISVRRDCENPRRGGLSYCLGSAYQRQGFAKEFIVPVIAAAFSRLDLEIIEAGAQVENAASFAVMRAGHMHAVGERLVYAHARNRQELCLFYEIRRPSIPQTNQG